MKLRFHKAVQREADEAVSWYQDQRHGLGGEFYDELIRSLDKIAEAPDHFSFWLRSKTVRRAQMKRFPYDLLFEIRPDKVKVLCLRHRKRHPNYGSQRK